MRSLQVASQLTLRTAKQTYMTSGTAPLRDVEGEGATEPVLQLVELSGGMWGTLLQAALAAAPEAKADTPAAAEQRIGKLIQSAAHIEPRCARCIHQLMVCVLLLPHVLGHFTYLLDSHLVCTLDWHCTNLLRFSKVTVSDALQVHGTGLPLLSRGTHIGACRR